MPTVTVLEKLYASVSPAAFKNSLSSLVEGLDMQVGFVKTTPKGWIQLNVSGADQTIAISLLDKKFGLAPNSVEGLGRFSVLRGKVVSEKNSERLLVDLPVGSDSFSAAVSEQSLQGQLADGKPVGFGRFVELFCLAEHLPVEVKLSEDINGSKPVGAVLSEGQVRLFRSWVQMRSDRLIVFKAQFSDVEKAVESCRLSRDVMRVEQLGFLEQAVLCKLGTDAVGLIPRLGRVLKSAVLVPFSPKKVIKQISAEAFDD